MVFSVVAKESVMVTWSLSSLAWPETVEPSCCAKARPVQAQTRMIPGRIWGTIFANVRRIVCQRREGFQLKLFRLSANEFFWTDAKPALRMGSRQINSKGPEFHDLQSLCNCAWRSERHRDFLERQHDHIRCRRL